MRRLLLALSFLTRLPVPRVEADRQDFAGAVRLYPLAGLAIGIPVALAGWAFGRVDPWLGALAATAAWVWATGALHLDGLADMADGLGAAHGDRTRLLAVMGDPHVGSFGVVALALQLAAKLVLLHLLLPLHWPALLLVPALARTGPLFWARFLAPLKPTGLGASIAGASRVRDLIGWGALSLAAGSLFPPLLAVFALVPVLAWWFGRTLGGMTGDVHGAGIELTETGLLLFLALQAAS